MVNITKEIQNLYAINKKTKKIKSINLLCIGSKQFNGSDDKYGVWHNYSKRNDWEIYIKGDELCQKLLKNV